MNEYKQIFSDFLEEAANSEARGKCGPAVSNYYKALTALCSYIIENKLQKKPRNHNEIFLFLKMSFPEIYKIVSEAFVIYTASYDNIMSKKDCETIKNAIKQIANIGRVEKEFKGNIEKLG